MFNDWKEFDKILNITVSDYQKEQLNNFYNILVKENSKYNLTRILSREEVFFKHFIDSLVFTRNFKITDQEIIDIGSGAGFPGIVLKIIFPKTKITLLDSNRKKTTFLNKVISKLELDNISAIHDRAEIYSETHEEKFDIAISRAVAYADIIIELSVKMVKVNGSVILLKGPKAEEELKTINHLLSKLKLTSPNMYNFFDERIGERTNIVFNKIGKTPLGYPREYSKIIKKSSKNKKGDKWV